MKHTTVLFDLDGTITDSGAGVMHGMEIALAHFGLPIPDRQALRVIIGPPLRDSFIRFGIKPEDTEEALVIYRKFYVADGWLENFVYPGLEMVLKSLKENGCRVYVATSKPEHMAVHILEHFGLAKYFDLICGATMDSTRDSKSDVIRYLLDQIEPDPSMVMVGDTHYDVEGAAAFQIPTIGVDWGYGENEDMIRSGAVAIAKDAAHLLQLLRGE
jgi:phosphoglycolate phosphatase